MTLWVYRLGTMSELLKPKVYWQEDSLDVNFTVHKVTKIAKNNEKFG